MSDLEEALTTVAAGDGAWLALADPRYESVNAMFGGWTAAIALRAVEDSIESGAKASAITINFINRIEPGSQIRIAAQALGGSRSVTHWRVDVTSATDGATLALATVVMTERRDSDGLTEPSMPTSPAPDSLGEFHPPGPQGERCMIRPISGTPPFGQPSTYSASWVQEMTGRPVDRLQLALLADQFAPRPWFWSDGPRPCSTMTMSVYFHATDDELAAVGDNYIFSEAVGTRGARSTSGQRARLWSRRGDLLATSEQLCWYR